MEYLEWELELLVNTCGLLQFPCPRNCPWSQQKGDAETLSLLPCQLLHILTLPSGVEGGGLEGLWKEMDLHSNLLSLLAK